MESVYNDKKQSGFSKKKALAIALSVFAVAIIISEPVYASVPWYITAIGAVAGGIVGSLTGSPIGTIAGATAGAVLADYLYSITHKDSQMPSYFPNQQKIENEFASSYINLTTQELITDSSQAKTTNELFTEDYYYNAQQQEALVPYFLGNSSLNLFNISLASGTYATINNISNSIYSPADIILWQTWFTGETSSNNGFTTDQVGQTYSFDAYNCITHFNLSGFVVYGSQIAKGNYMFVFPQNVSTSIYRFDSGLAYLNLTNFYTGKTYNVSANGVMPLNTSKIPYGFYHINDNSSNLITTGIQVLSNGALDTTLSSGYTSYFGSSARTIAPVPNMILVNQSLFGSNQITIYADGNPACSSSVYTEADASSINRAFNPATTFSGMTNYYTSFQSNLNNIYSAANSYFTTLKNLGYTNINQIPANQIIPFPSDVVPSSMLNGSFNYQELEEMYIAYLNDLNTTFHNSTLFNGKNFTKYVNQTMFVNGFLTVYGNLCYNKNATIKAYVNDTDFFIQTYTNKLNFAVGKTTNLTGEIYPVLILNGSENGSLLYVDASIYVISLSLAGKNITSYTLEPEQITYVLPKTVGVSPVNYNPLFNNVSNFLEKYYIILTIIIVIAVIAYIYDRKRPDSKGKGKE